ncbi:hypothetical protein DXG01_000479, partial [Tephrocybe rancida]
PALATQEVNNEDHDDSDINVLDLPVMSENLQDVNMCKEGFYNNLPFIACV